MDPHDLEDEVETWVDDGIITREQGEEILARYETDGPRRSRVVQVLSLVGAALVFVGVTLFLATNWGDLPRPARALVLVAGPGLAYLGGGVAYRRNASSVGHALCVLGAVLVGPSLFLFEDLFALGLVDAWLLLGWVAVALPTGHALDSRAGTGFGLLVLVALVVELAEPTDPVPAVGLLGIVLFTLGHVRNGRVPWLYRVGGVTITLAALLILTTLEGRFDWFELEVTAILVAGLIGAVAGTGWLASRADWTASLWAVTGLAALALSVAVGTLAPQSVPELPAFLGIHVAVLASIVATGYLGYRSASRTLVDLAAVGALFQTLSFVAATVVDELSGSIALVVAGLILLAAGLALERGRRSVLERL